MTPAEQTLIQTTFAKVAAIGDPAAVLFYDELFQRDPSLRRLFSDDMRDQRQKLLAMLSTAVAQLDNWAATSAVLQALGRRHVAYGVTPADYATVRNALIATLEKGLGDSFTPEVRSAWESCISAIATEMIGAAGAHRSSPPV
jgi:hemoglobin-like flavoprotein